MAWPAKAYSCLTSLFASQQFTSPFRLYASDAKTLRLSPISSSKASSRAITFQASVFLRAQRRRLLQHDWPGNARELSSVLESAVLNAPHGIIRADDLGIVFTPPASPRPTPPSPQILNLDAVILNHIHMVLDLNHGNKLKSARQLGISRSTLYRLLGAGTSSTC